MESRVSFGTSGAEAPLWIQTEEDPQTSIAAFGGGISGKKLLCVASGGCTPIAFIAAGAQEVFAVDIDPKQIAISELKLRSIEILEFSEFQQMWLNANDSKTVEYYYLIEKYLSPETQTLLQPWFAIPDSRPLIEKGSMQGIGTELSHLHPDLFRLLRRWFTIPSIQQQSHYYQEYLENLETIVAQLRQNRAEKYFGGGSSEHSDRAIGREMRLSYERRFQHLINNIPIQGNPFAAQMLLGDYPCDARPSYLTENVYNLVKTSIHSIKLILGDLVTAIDSFDSNSLHGADLSNVTDLLPETDVRHLFVSLARALRNDAIVVHRNLVWGEPYLEVEPFLRQYEQSNSLTAKDRSFIYSAITVDKLKK